MTGILLNFLEFDKNPLSEKLEIVKYSPLESVNLDFYDVGFIVRELRRKNRRIAIFHTGKNVYSSDNLKTTSETFDNIYQSRVRFELIYTNPDHRKIIEKLLGSIVINFLMNDPSQTWKISEKIKKQVYEVLKYEEYVYKSREIELKRGFIFSPRLLSDGRIGLFIDSRVKLFYIDTLKNQDLLDMVKQSEHKYLVDYCPIEKCNEKSNSFSSCKLSIPSSGLIFKGENLETSAEISISGENLIQYHNKKKICFKQVLGDHLDPDLKTIKVEISNKPYDFPPERLRPQPRFDRIDPEDRPKVMDEIVLDPVSRFKISLDYALILKEIFISNFKFKSSNPFYLQRKDHIGRKISFKKIPLELFNEKLSLVPALEIQRYKPWDYDEKTHEIISIGIIYLGHFNGSNYNLIKDALNNENKFRVCFSKMFNFKKVDIKEINAPSNAEIKFETLENILRKNKIDIIILVYGNLNEKDIIFVNELKSYLYKKSKLIPTQGINFSTFLNSYNKNITNYFRNIFLGIYAKSGYTAWRLNKRERKNELYLGININSNKQLEEKAISIAIYSNIGIFVKIYYFKCKINDFEKNLINILNKIIKINKNLVLNCLFLGNLYDDDKNIFVKTFQSHNINYSIFEIHQNSLVRIYFEKEGRIAPTKIGDSIVLDGSEAYFISFKNYQGTSQPTKVVKIESSFDLDFDEYLQHFFDLTQCYTGYSQFRITLPIPIHAARHTLNDFINLDVKEIETNLPIFI